jgi:FkbM family methyltransferase
MSKIKAKISKRLREVVLRHYLVPYSRHGLPSALVQWFRPHSPITFIDVGASHGLFVDAIEKHFEVCKALLVEPLPNRCQELAKRFKEPVYTVCQQALADYEGIADFNVFDFDYASSLHTLPTEKTGIIEGLELGQVRKLPVRVGTLDALLKVCEIGDRIDLLKMDVQGGELNLLKGAKESLPKISNIWCEVSFEEIYENAAIFRDVYDFLASAGFGVKAISDCERGKDGNLVWVDVLFSRGSQNEGC